MLKDDFDIMLLGGYGHIKRDLVVVPSYTAKGLEFDSVIIINNFIRIKIDQISNCRY